MPQKKFKIVIDVTEEQKTVKNQLRFNNSINLHSALVALQSAAEMITKSVIQSFPEESKMPPEKFAQFLSTKTFNDLTN